MNLSLFKVLRIGLLLVVLVAVWTTAQQNKNVARGWIGTSKVMIIPIVGDKDDGTREYVESLRADNFVEIKNYIESQARRYRPDLINIIEFSVEPAIDVMPPTTPSSGSNKLSIVFWSLKLRWWAWRNQPKNFTNNNIRIYVQYSRPMENTLLPHSTGLQNGLIGLVYARAYNKYNSLNNVIVAHELMHIFGATDKYDLSSGMALFPQGYVNPDQQPRHPQRFGEIMARSIPISESNHDLSNRLRITQVGKITAREIGWLE